MKKGCLYFASEGSRRVLACRRVAHNRLCVLRVPNNVFQILDHVKAPQAAVFWCEHAFVYPTVLNLAALCLNLCYCEVCESFRSAVVTYELSESERELRKALSAARFVALAHNALRESEER